MNLVTEGQAQMHDVLFLACIALLAAAGMVGLWVL